VFNVGLGEILVIVLVCLLVFGPERLPEMARQTGRFLGQLRLTTQNALDQLKDETELSDLNLPDLRVGSLRAQARDYVRDLMDIEGQMEELRQAANSDGPADDTTRSRATPTTTEGPPPIDLEAT
jgi:sec-independent protein translocase protein TatB